MGPGGTTQAQASRRRSAPDRGRLVETRLGISDTFAAHPDLLGRQAGLRAPRRQGHSGPQHPRHRAQTGEVDLIYGAAGQSRPRPSCACATRPRPSPPRSRAARHTRVLALNSARFPTDDPAVRRARSTRRSTRTPWCVPSSTGSSPGPISCSRRVSRRRCRADPLTASTRAAAERLLDGAGWAKGRDGMRAKAGRALAVELDFVWYQCPAEGDRRGDPRPISPASASPCASSARRRARSSPARRRTLRPDLRRDLGPALRSRLLRQRDAGALPRRLPGPEGPARQGGDRRHHHGGSRRPPTPPSGSASTPRS